jgi:hypothetical protein
MKLLNRERGKSGLNRVHENGESLSGIGREFSLFMQDLKFFRGITTTDQKCESATKNCEGVGLFNNYAVCHAEPSSYK